METERRPGCSVACARPSLRELRRPAASTRRRRRQSPPPQAEMAAASVATLRRRRPSGEPSSIPKPKLPKAFHRPVRHRSRQSHARSRICVVCVACVRARDPLHPIPLWQDPSLARTCLLNTTTNPRDFTLQRLLLLLVLLPLLHMLPSNR